jgi:hypothetical protein
MWLINGGLCFAIFMGRLDPHSLDNGHKKECRSRWIQIGEFIKFDKRDLFEREGDLLPRCGSGFTGSYDADSVSGSV